jgi:succinate dehydrogenase hydrophobic anchor subunit
MFTLQMVEERAKREEPVVLWLRRGFWVVCLALAVLSVGFIVAVHQSLAENRTVTDVVRMEASRVQLQQLVMFHVATAALIASGAPHQLTFDDVNAALLRDLEELQSVHDNLTVVYPPQTPEHVRDDTAWLL